jgi:ADP-ribose pyrophosphatase
VKLADQGKDATPSRAWRTLERREVLDVPGRFSIAVETVQLPDGRVVDDYWQILAGHYAVIFAQTPEGEALCLEQYRHGARREGIELIAGLIEPGEEPVEAARRELLEETGYVCENWKPMGTYVISASQGSGHVHFFHATGARKVQPPGTQDLEASTVVLLPRKKLLAEMRSGRFMTADHLAAIGMALLLA